MHFYPAVAYRRPATAQHVAGSGTPLILLHGIGGNWAIWKPVIAALAERHRVIALTLPGHHGGPPFGAVGDATVSALADQVLEMLRSQGLSSAHIVGNSLGGWLALELARRGFARSVVALSPAGGKLEDADYHAASRPVLIAHRIARVMYALLGPLAGWSALRRSAMAQTMEHGERMSPDDFRMALRAYSKAAVLPGLIRTMRHRPFEALDAGDVSVLVAWSELDQVIPYSRYGQPLVDKIGGASMKFIPGAGHVPMYDNPEFIVQQILELTSAVDDRTPNKESA